MKTIFLNKHHMVVGVATLYVFLAWLIPVVGNLELQHSMRQQNLTTYMHSEGQQRQEDSPYMIIIDGGSTGSRLHIFEFADGVCHRRGSIRTEGPLSAFAPDPWTVGKEFVDVAAVTMHILPAFQFAAEIIPAKYHATTIVQYQATAGMRLLSEEDQDAVYNAMYQGLMESSEFVFSSLQRTDLATLSGELEGFYGAVAANYLKGIINADMDIMTTGAPQETPSVDNRHAGPIGALDMGGSSTQIVFVPKLKESCEDSDDNRSCSISSSAKDKQSRLNGDEFFSTSYLSYGVDQFRERLWNALVREHEKKVKASDSCDSKLIENPCAFNGYEVQWQDYTLIGTGQTQSCVEYVQRLIPHPVDADHDEVMTLGARRGMVGGVEHPPVRGKFYAMSLYFFTLDSLRELSTANKRAHDILNRHWPTPSINELSDALDGLCRRNWYGDLHEIQDNAHPFTRPEVLPHRCLESVYLVTLLRDGFGFDPDARDITFTFLLDGSEVEWTLGMALALRAQFKERHTHVAADTTAMQWSRFLGQLSSQFFSAVSS